MKPSPALTQQNTAVDWPQVHRRLEAVRAAMEQGRQPGPEETTQLLTARAQRLAQETSSAQEPQDTLEVIEFVLAYERYAVESVHVREVYPLKELTPLPGTPAHVLGIINLRGQILSVIDIKRFFDLPPKGLGNLDKVIVLRSDAMEFGILADQIIGTRLVSTSDLQASLPTLTGIRENYLKGVTADRLVVLDAQKLLSDRMVVVDEQVGTKTQKG